MTTRSCPICRATNGTHKMDCQNRAYVRECVEVELTNVETIAPKQIVFELDKDSVEIYLVSVDDEPVLTAMPGGGLMAFGCIPLTPEQVQVALAAYCKGMPRDTT